MVTTNSSEFVTALILAFFFSLVMASGTLWVLSAICYTKIIIIIIKRFLIDAEEYRGYHSKDFFMGENIEDSTHIATLFSHKNGG